MRHISFFYTQAQIIDGSKSVTRRLGWKKVKPGELLQGVVKGQGLKKGEQVTKLRVVRVVDVRRERLSSITREDVAREGYPEPAGGSRYDYREWFIEHFCKMNDCTRRTMVTRIAFEYVDG